MPRPVAIRASYRNDAAFLLRLEEAIGLDPIARRVWKRITTKSIRKVVHLLLSAEQERVKGHRPESRPLKEGPQIQPNGQR